MRPRARTLSSLARGSFVPAAVDEMTSEGAPVNALLISGLGQPATIVVRVLWPGSAYVWFFGVALFSALFVWLMIFVTHIAFRGATAPAASYEEIQDCRTAWSECSTELNHG